MVSQIPFGQVLHLSLLHDWPLTPCAFGDQAPYQVMLRIRRDHEGPWLDRLQVVFPHKPYHPFVVDQEAAPTEFRRNAGRKTFGNLPTRFLATRHPLLVPSVPIPRVSI